MTSLEFSELRYGMFLHFGIYSMLARGEWVMNREQIPAAEMEMIAKEKENTLDNYNNLGVIHG